MSEEAKKQTVRTRIAPSPTGYPHIGTIYQALFNYAFAHKHDGKFVVRIEDTDRTRFVADAEEALYDALDWFDLSENESPRMGGENEPYKQSERLQKYHEHAQMLLDAGKAYFAYYPKDEAGKKKDYTQKSTLEVKTSDVVGDAPQTIAEMIKSGDWILRMKVPPDTKITIKDEIRGEIEFDSNQVTEQVLIKSDGYPTYHLAAVVDDHLMGITHVVRAEEWLSSTPKHWLLYEYFNWDKPLFFHTSLLRNMDKSKVSKRHGHANTGWYREEGYLPEAILNFLALMGWSHPEEKEIFSREEFVASFDLKDMKAVGPIFDLTKLTWMNQQYIQMKSDDELKKIIAKFFPKVSELLAETFDSLIPLVKTRMTTLKEFEQLTKMFFENVEFSALNDQEKQVGEEMRDGFEKISDWHKDEIFHTIKKILVKYKVRMPLLYKMLTGEERGLPLPESLEILGKEKTLGRLKSILI
jgi:glutamyl-tRNA synthetase